MAVTGTVKWFDSYKGFGFITVDNEDKDIFAHYSDIEGEEGTRKNIEENQKVTFDIEKTDKGEKAVNIKSA